MVHVLAWLSIIFSSPAFAADEVKLKCVASHPRAEEYCKGGQFVALATATWPHERQYVLSTRIQCPDAPRERWLQTFNATTLERVSITEGDLSRDQVVFRVGSRAWDQPLVSFGSLWLDTATDQPGTYRAYRGRGDGAFAPDVREFTCQLF